MEERNGESYMNNAIVLKGFDDPSLAQDFLHERCLIISKSSKIKSVTSLPSEEIAVESLSAIQKMKRDLEKLRKEVKEKPFQLCKKIDAIAAQASEPLEQEENRVKQLLGNYAEIKRQEAEKEEILRQEEIQKIQEQQRIEEEKAAKAAQAQAAAEAEAARCLQRAAQAKDEASRKEAERLAREAGRIADENRKKLAESSAEAQRREDAIRESVPVVLTKASNASTKFILKYEVLDMNELFANYPHVCEITEKKSSVNMLINGLQMANPNELPKVRGLRVYRVADINTRN